MTVPHRRMQREPAPESEEPFSAWPLVVGIGATKLATLAVVIGLAADRESLLLTGATILPWLVIGAGLVAAPLAWRLRLRRVRRRRAALIRAEWEERVQSAELRMPKTDPGAHS